MKLGGIGRRGRDEAGRNRKRKMKLGGIGTRRRNEAGRNRKKKNTRRRTPGSGRGGKKDPSGM